MKPQIMSSSLLLMLLAPLMPLQAVELFRQPTSTQPFPEEEVLNCAQIEQEISNLLPLTYSYKPGFFSNPYQGAAVMAGTIQTPVFYLYSAYDYYLDYHENNRILPNLDKLERLRRQKAEKHCFES